MLLTNIAVAQQVAVHFSEQAMLRRHDSPIERRLVSGLAYLQEYQRRTLSVERVCRPRGAPGLQGGHVFGCLSYEVARGRRGSHRSHYSGITPAESLPSCQVLLCGHARHCQVWSLRP